jgi:hypothetical protein
MISGFFKFGNIYPSDLNLERFISLFYLLVLGKLLYFNLVRQYSLIFCLLNLLGFDFCRYTKGWFS